MANLLEIQDKYVSHALEAMQFKLIRKPEDIENDYLIFHPTFAHQAFGDKETIFGYLGLKIIFMYTAGPMDLYLGMTYDERVENEPGNYLKADRVLETITEMLPTEGCYYFSTASFLRTLDKIATFKPFGEKMTEFTWIDPETGDEYIYEIYICDHHNDGFLKFFNRLQTFILWFVDAASLIDIDDGAWRYYVAYEKYKSDNGDWLYATAGYTTVYEYYAYPSNIRPRISQMLVLPPFQKRGIGTKFLEIIYQNYRAKTNVYDITVEDPSENFQRLRNLMDVRLCMALESFSKEEILKGHSKEMDQEARTELNITPPQTRIVFEILRLHYTNINDPEEYRNYRLLVKKRLNANYYKQQLDLERLERLNRLDKASFNRATQVTKEEHLMELHEKYLQVESEYKRVLEKL